MTHENCTEGGKKDRADIIKEMTQSFLQRFPEKRDPSLNVLIAHMFNRKCSRVWPEEEGSEIDQDDFDLEFTFTIITAKRVMELAKPLHKCSHQ